MTDPRYPIGPFVPPKSVSPDARAAEIATIAGAALALREAISGLSDAQLDTPYREGGWTVRQVVHHLADSHANAYIRVKMTLTEDSPTIKPYDEQAWAQLEDSRTTPIEVSLSMLAAIHDRMVRVLRSMTPGDFARTYVHPQSGKHDLDFAVSMYAWHARHHIAHVLELRRQRGW